MLDDFAVVFFGIVWGSPYIGMIAMRPERIAQGGQFLYAKLYWGGPVTELPSCFLGITD